MTNEQLRDKIVRHVHERGGKSVRLVQLAHDWGMDREDLQRCVDSSPLLELGRAGWIQVNPTALAVYDRHTPEREPEPESDQPDAAFARPKPLKPAPPKEDVKLSNPASPNPPENPFEVKGLYRILFDHGAVTVVCNTPREVLALVEAIRARRV